MGLNSPMLNRLRGNGINKTNSYLGETQGQKLHLDAKRLDGRGGRSYPHAWNCITSPAGLASEPPLPLQISVCCPMSASGWSRR